MREISVESLKDYIAEVLKIAERYPISRGQEEDYPLLPSALREDERGNKIYSESTIRNFIDDFKLNAILYIDKTIDYNEVEWLVYAQHFGVPTCLLDFTYSPLISLLFAVENAFKYKDDDDKESIVWFLDVDGLNKESINKKGPVNISTKDRLPLQANRPYVITARKNNSRMMAQNGLFVYFSARDKALDKDEFIDNVLVKIKIPHSVAKEILRDLYYIGMRFDFIYPELSSISRDILLKNDICEMKKLEG